MKNFGRALKLTMAYRWQLVTSLVAAVMVAVLWGGNLTAIYPCVEMVLKGRSASDWAEWQIDYANTVVEKSEEKIASLRGEMNDATEVETKRIQSEIQTLEDRIAAEKSAAEKYGRLLPYLKKYLPDDPFQTLVLVLGVLLLGTMLKALFLIISQVFVAWLAGRAELEIREQFYERTLEMDVASLSRQGTGDLMNRFTQNIGKMSGGLANFWGRTIREPLKMIVCLVGAALVCWRLLLLTLIVAPLAGYLVNRLAKSLKRANHRAMQEMSLVYENLSEKLAGIKVVKAFTMERQEQDRFSSIARQYFRKAMKIARRSALISPLNEVMGMVMISLAVLAGAWLALSHETHMFGIKMSDRRLTPGDLMLFFGLLAGISDPARKLSTIFTQLQGAFAAADRVYEILDRAPKVADPENPQPLKRHQKQLVLDSVHFSYEPNKPILTDVNLNVPFGQTVAIVGSNGCGKSTMLNLFSRFFDVDKGSVTIDGVDVRDVLRRDVRKQIGLVTQETFLFDDTVFENVRYGTPDATHEQVVAAAKRAHAHEFITDNLSEGYDTKVGSGGSRLSGGQRQRIALARAILRDPPILILDEATSQIDLESEQLIHEALREFIQNRTTFIITHRTSTLALADRIVVMKQGRILDVGTHQELTARCDFYRRIHEIDFKQIA
ncbi:MAG: ABC transporter ATP-binding protein/permease [Pirellulales bacterium]|nr:ABC transporter ATP-binding protein/permease [Pirellulales bacterium]